jgi:hypothetical protein
MPRTGWSSRSIFGEDSMGYFSLAKGVIHTGGVVAATGSKETMETGEVLYAPQRNLRRRAAL